MMSFLSLSFFFLGSGVLLCLPLFSPIDYRHIVILICFHGEIQPRYQHVKQINLEFARDIEDKHLELIKNKCLDSLQNLEVLNLNGCQKISDKGIEAITSACPNLKVFSIYWNVRVTDIGIAHLVKNCKHIVDLNFSGCKTIACN